MLKFRFRIRWPRAVDLSNIKSNSTTTYNTHKYTKTMRIKRSISVSVYFQTEQTRVGSGKCVEKHPMTEGFVFLQKAACDRGGSQLTVAQLVLSLPEHKVMKAQLVLSLLEHKVTKAE